MPSNWTALHWGLSGENAAVVTAVAEGRVKSALDAFLAGKRHYDGVVQLFFGLLLAKISLMYLILGQLFFAKLFFADDTCTGCGLCKTICPKRAVRLAGRPPRPYWTYACDSCMACINFCPHKAIQVSPLVAILIYYLATVPALAWAMALASARLGFDLASVPLLGFSVQYAYTLLAIAAAYSLLHLAFGSRLLRFLAARLSHTRYFRRYTAPGVSLADIHKQ
ncbi:4Fe-4S binding protein [Anaeroselena agilis]|uniref:4Fe-4S binding protein n=1 Tax=Anaeroselena agilis TaxID=3063788 RepID=A0ABU3NXL4_9FIRM|nr:4Fe-4S binding protein [Selenomonadales bacterium 4137-cl]